MGGSAGRAGLTAGIAAALVATAAMAVVRLATDLVSPAELVADAVLLYLPPSVFSAVLDLLQFYAKRVLLVGILAGQIATGAALGIAYVRLGAGLGAAAMVGGALALLSAVAIPALSGAGPLGSGLRSGWLSYTAQAVGLSVLFTVCLDRWYRLLTVPGTEARRASAGRMNRRALLAKALVGAGLVVGGAALAREYLAKGRGVSPAVVTGGVPDAPAAAEGRGPPAAVSTFEAPGMPPEITPTKDFYVVSKNFFDPVVDRNSWRLKVHGLVERELELTYADIRALPAVEQYQTLECISNLVGGDLISNAHWRGARLRDVLAAAGVRPGVVDVALFAADDYSDSIPLDKALEPGTLLAYEMNGEPLTSEHGAPVRLLVPGIYGMKNVKWLTRVQLVDYDFKGYWMVRGWSDVAVIKTMSRVDTPDWRASLSTEGTVVGGIAFAGDRGISRVEISFDNGATWQPAMLKPALGRYTWVLWATVWRPPSPGAYTIKVRAVDGSGEVQTEVVADPLPDGATGLHSVTVRVAG